LNKIATMPDLEIAFVFRVKITMAITMGADYMKLSALSFSISPHDVDQPCPALPAKVTTTVRNLSK